MKDQRSEFRQINEWWMFCIVSLSLIKSTKLLTCSVSCRLFSPPTLFKHVCPYPVVMLIFVSCFLLSVLCPTTQPAVVHFSMYN